MTCMKCGGISAAMPLCDRCAEEILKKEDARRRKMSLMFTVIVVIAIIMIYLVKYA